MSCAKMAEPIEIELGGSRKRVCITWGIDTPMERAHWGVWPIEKRCKA